MITVFKGFMTLLKQHIGFICMYFCIFLCIALATVHLGRSGTMENFEALKLDLAIVDEDNSELSREMIDYLKEIHDVTVTEADNSELYERLYYEGINSVLCLKKGFAEKAEAGESCVEITPQLGASYSGVYLEEQVNRILGNVMKFHMLGMPLEECFDKVKELPEAKVTAFNGDSLENKQTYGMYFRFLPYLFLSALGASMATVLYSFRKDSLRKRMTASSVSVTKQNISIFLGFFLVGTCIYILTIAMAIIMYGKDLLNTEGMWYYFLNAWLMMLISLAFSFLVGVLAKKGEAITMIVTSVSLALSFIGGVFVPMEVLDSKIKLLSHFLPVYWYEQSNDLLTAPTGLTDEAVLQIWQGTGMQLLFLLAMLGGSMAIVKHQQRE